MSNVAALLCHRMLKVSDGIYFERVDAKESAIEGRLRALFGGGVTQLRFLKRRWHSLVSNANKLETQMKGFSDTDLRHNFYFVCRKMRKKGFSDALLAQAFAIVRESSYRTLGMRHHDVQLIGAWTLLQGKIAEMAIGEGKTAATAACIAAATGVKVHVITVNDYLSSRDAEKINAYIIF